MCETHYFPQIEYAARKNAQPDPGNQQMKKSKKRTFTWIWMEDGASNHSAAATQARFDELRVARLPCWPCNSPG